MAYIQLSHLPLPNTALRTTLFPFLFQEEVGGGHSLYQFSLLVCNRNRMAQAFLKALGFLEDISTSLPGGAADDLWTFFRCKPTGPEFLEGPFDPLSDALAAPDPHALATYLTFGTLSTVTADIRQPDTITVNDAELKAEALNQVAEVKLASIKFARSGNSPLGWTLRFAAANNTVDQTAVEFLLPASGLVPLARQGLSPNDKPVQFDITAQLVDLPDAGSEWSGSILRLNGFDLVGGPDDRLPLGGAALVTKQGEAHYEWEPTARWSIPKGAGGLFRITFAVQALRLRFSEKEIGVYLLNSATGSPVRLRVDFEFPLIMAKLEDAIPEALELIIPLTDAGDGPLPSLKWGISFDVGPEWDAENQAVFSSPADAWDFGEEFLNHDWPIYFVDQSHGMALGGLQFSLADLLGDALGAVGFDLGPSLMGQMPHSLQGGKIAVPVHFTTSIGDQRLNLDLMLEIDLTTFRLTKNRLDFSFPVAAHGESLQIIDLGAFAILIPNRAAPTDVADGYIDFGSREFGLKKAADNVHAPWLVVPGGLSGSEPDDRPLSEHEESSASDFTNRLIFELQPDFDPDYWPQEGAPENPDKRAYLRINGNGISLHAKIDTSHVVTVFAGDNLSPAVTVRPQQERKGKVSQIVLIDNVIREACVCAEMDVPGTDDLVAAIEMGLRQQRRGAPPVVFAAVDLDTTDGSPIAQLTAGYLQLAIDDFHDWTLTWDTGRKDWNLKLPTDLRLSVAPRTGSVGGLDQLRQGDAIKVRDLDLMNLHRGAGSIELNLDRDVEFDCLEGMFGIRLKQLTFGWGTNFFMACETAEFTFKNPGAFAVTIEAGGVRLEFIGGSRLKMRNPSRIGIDASIGDAVRFRGAVAWVDDDRERYFAAAGTLTIEGLPEAATLLKLGSGVKNNGQVVPNIVLYGAADQEITLFAGAVAKTFGAGIGINNRLKGIGDHPDAEQILANIDSLDPSRIEGWEFVTRNGFFLSIVGTTILASNEGGNSTQNAYVAALVLSIDLDLNVVAAGKMWLYSSVDYVRRRENWRRPALVGAITLTPRERLITAAIESKPNPAIESNDRIAEILNKGHVKLSFVISPKLVDFFLQDVTYRDQFLGVDMQYRGSMRFAIFGGTVLLRATQSVTGYFNRTFSEGPGGFSTEGDIAVLVEFGGLISERGLAAYGLIGISISLPVQAWIKIEYSFTVGYGRWKKRIGVSKTLRLPAATRLELGLRGAIAFNESSQFGFDGQLSISVPICGYPLNIAASVRVNPEVIAEVRGRVAAFERRIEAYRQELLGGTSLQAAAPMMLVSASEEWLLYESGGWMFLIPNAESPWLTPSIARIETRDGQPAPVFTDYVQCISITRDRHDGSAPVTVRKLYTPWDANNKKVLAGNHPDRFHRFEDELEEVETIMAETAHRTVGGSGAINPLPAFRPVSDPRFASTGREFWTDEDRVRLPDYALPVRLRSVDDILSSASGANASESDYIRLVDYLYWRGRAARIQRHRGGDRDESKQVAHNRGVVNQLLLDQLRSVSTDNDYRSAWVGGPVKTDADPDWFGLIFHIPDFDIGKQFDELSFEIVRMSADGVATVTTITVRRPTSPEAIDAARARVRVLPPRQQFVIDHAGADATTAGETGRVIVKLPISLSPEFLQTAHLATFSHFRIYRRFPWQEKPEIVGDQVRPELVYVDEDRASGQEHVVVMGPFLFTDEFSVRERKLSTPGLRAELTEIEYHLELVPVGDFSAPKAESTSPWPKVRLHVPALDTFPTDLGLVFPFDSLAYPARPDQPLGHFALVSTGTEGTPLATVPVDSKNVRLLTPDDFEIWAEPILLSLFGFYAGSVETSDSSKGAGAADPVLDDLSAKSPSSGARTTDGLFQLTLDEVDPSDPGWFRPSAATAARLVKPGFGFRFFVRPMIRPAVTGGGGAPMAIGPVRPLPAFLSRAKPPVDSSAVLARWRQPPRLRPIRQIEFIPAPLVAGIRAGIATWTPITLSERPLDRKMLQYRPDRTRRHLGLDWTLTDAHQGGAEILIRDLHDTALQARLMCESVSAGVYQRRIPDFRNASIWQLTRLEQSSRLTWEERPEPTIYDPPGGNFPSPIDQLLLIDPSNPVISRLERQRVELTRTLNDSRTYWKDLLVAAKNWMTAVYEFRKSPINLNDEPVRETIAKVEILLKCLLTGRTDAALAPNATLNADARKRIADETASLLGEIEAIDPGQLGLGDETEAQHLASRRTLVDLDLAKRLAAIARGREVVAEEIFDSSNDDPPALAGDVRGSSWLPRGNRFEDLRAKQREQTAALAGPLVLSERLLALYGKSAADGISGAVARDSLVIEIDQLYRLAVFEAGSDGSDADRRRKAAAAIVTKGAGLTKAFNRLDALLSTVQARGERRPHHQVAVKSTAEDEKTAQPTPLESLLPDEASGQGETVVLDAPPSREVVAYYNLLERMGFALDVAATGPLGDELSQSELLERLRSAHLVDLIPRNEDLDVHVVQILVGREPDSEFLGAFPDRAGDSVNDGYIGHSFVKIAVIPQSFHDLLVSRTNLDQLKDWFSLRKVDLGDDSERATALLERLGRTASYVAHGQSLEKVMTVRVEVRDRRWVSLPAVNGASHVDWPVPDTRGHRFEAVARYVSCYEPVIRWALGNYVPVDWPEMDPTVEPASITVRRLVTEDLQSSTFVADVPENLPVSLYGHPELIRFSYLLPSAGARSLLNVISAVRTGYQGVSAVFRYELRDHDKEEQPNGTATVRPLGWDRLLGEIELRVPVAGDPKSLISDPPAITKAAPQNVLVDVRLMRNERMLTLRDMPYFYQYRLHVRSQYEADFVRPAAVAAPVIDHPARREPKILACRPPSISTVLDPNGMSAVVTIEVRLTRTGDLLTPAEWSASPPLEPRAEVVHTHGVTATIALGADQLPEPSMGYHFYYQVKDADYYVSVAELLMPWHPAYKPRQGQPLRPWFRLLDSRASYVELGDEWPTIIVGQSEHGTDAALDQPAYIVKLRFEVIRLAGEAEILFAAPDRRRMQVSRAGTLSDPIPQEVNGHG